MADRTRIEWTDTTWNPVTGCTKVSPGCDHCYAETFANRWRGVPGHHFTNGFQVTLRPGRLTEPLGWRRPRRVFVNSMSDLFHSDVPDEFITTVWTVMARTPQHTYQVLTKRPGRMRSLLEGVVVRDQVRQAVPGVEWPLSNVWLGVSAEDQRWADLRVPVLLTTPAVVHWLSCEPLLGPIKLRRAVIPMGDQRGHGLTASYVHTSDCCQGLHGIDWVVAGGESGAGARPMHPDWVRGLRDQCQAAGVAFFLKQAGKVLAREWGCADRVGRVPAEWPEPFPRDYPPPSEAGRWS